MVAEDAPTKQRQEQSAGSGFHSVDDGCADRGFIGRLENEPCKVGPF